MSRLLAAARNFNGALRDEDRRRVAAYLAAPSEDAWDVIHGLQIAPSMSRGTLWQAVIAVDPTFPRRGPSHDARGRQLRGWERFPDAVLLARAIRSALQTNGEAGRKNRQGREKK